MSAKKDLTGKRFGRLVVQYEAEPHYTKGGQRNVVWHCLCDCGNEKDIKAENLSRGTQSCGCLVRELLSDRQTKDNTYDLSNDYAIGYTSKMEPFFFDKEDYSKISQYCWRLRNDGYLDAKRKDGTNKRVLMHNLIMGQKYIDHINGVPNDNRKCNLRIPPTKFNFDTYNQMNKKLQSNNTSGYRGVTWHKRDKLWECNISIGNKQIYLGRAKNFEEAVKIRKKQKKNILKNILMRIVERLEIL